MRVIAATLKILFLLVVSAFADGGENRPSVAAGHRGREAGAFAVNGAVTAARFGSMPQEFMGRAARGERPGSVHEFYFTRAIYGSGLASRWTPSWATDYPKADLQFLIGLKRLTNIDAYDFDNAIELDDPHLRRYPFLYALEVGYMGLSEAEVEGLRGYLLAGGFLMIDDFWGSWQWQNFEFEMQRVLPGYSIVELPMDHPIFSMFYDIEEIVQVPNVGLGKAGGHTWELDGYYPHVRGIFDEDGRLMVAINWNTDLGDAWEWADDPYYPLMFSTYAYEMGINIILYAMSH